MSKHKAIEVRLPKMEGHAQWFSIERISNEIRIMKLPGGLVTTIPLAAVDEVIAALETLKK